MLQDLRFRIVGTDASAPAFKSVQGNVAQTDKAVMALNGSILTAGRSLIGAFAKGFVVGGLASLPTVLQETAKAAANIGDVADKVGLTTDELQELRYAAEQTGVETRAMDVAMQRFSRRTAQAAAGQGELVDILRANGIALRDNEGNMRPLVDILGDYAVLIKNAGSEQEALLLAFKAFDTEGAALVNTLRNGGDALDDMGAAAHEVNQVLGEDLIRTAQDVDAQFKELSGTIGTFFQRAVLGAVNAFDSIGDILGRVPEEFQMMQAKVLLATGGGAALQQDFTGFLRSGGQTVIPEKERRDQAAEAADKQRQRVDDLIKSLQFEAEQLQRTAEQQELYNALKQAGAGLTDEQRRAIEQEVAHLQAVRAEMEALEAQEKAVLEAQGFLLSTSSNALLAIINYGGDAEDVMKRLAIAIGEAALQAALLGQGPLAGLFGGAGGFLSGLFGGGTVTNGITGLLPAIYHSGGVVGATPAPVRPVSASVFAGAPRMHSGGVAGLRSDEVPAILQRGETVIPRGGGVKRTNVSINVNISGARGNREIVEMIEVGVGRGLDRFQRDVLPGQIRDHTSIGLRRGDIRR